MADVGRAAWPPRIPPVVVLALALLLFSPGLVGCAGPTEETPGFWLSRAEAELAGIEDLDLRRGALVRIGATCIKISGPASGKAIVERLGDEQVRDDFQKVVALSYGDRLDFVHAIVEANAIHSQDGREESLASLAIRIALRGDVPGAVKLANRLAEERRDRTMNDMVREFAMKGDLANAKRMLKHLVDQRAKEQIEPRILAADGLTCAEALHKEVASLRQRIGPEKTENAEFLAAVARARGGDGAGVAAILAEMHPETRVEAALRAASLLVERAKVDSALSLVASVQADASRAYHLVMAAEVYASARRYPDALRMVRRVDFGSLDASEAFVTFQCAKSHFSALRILLDAGEAQEAGRMAANLGPAFRVGTLDRFAAYWASRGTRKQLDDFLHSCTQPYERAIAFCGVAEAMHARRDGHTP